ncbi:MAG: GrpB family protein [Bacteroidota bacterium]
MMLIQAYKAQWAEDFQTLRSVIWPATQAFCLDFHHIGSTSVPGLAAKAIIDMDLVYTDEKTFQGLKSALETLGYYHNGDQGIPGREAFKRPKGRGSHTILDHIPHHLYACPPHSRELERHLRLRDYLRTHEAARLAYAQLKQEIAREVDQDLKKYALLKEEKARDLIENMLEKARTTR